MRDHPRAGFALAVAISASDIIAATSRRMVIASARPFRAARLMARRHRFASRRLAHPGSPSDPGRFLPPRVSRASLLELPDRAA